MKRIMVVCSVVLASAAVYGQGRGRGPSPEQLAQRAKQEAISSSTESAKKLEAEQQQMATKLSSDIGDVKQQASTANTKIDSVSTEVGSVKGDVANTKTELEKTVAELKSVRGDLSGTNSLVATNGIPNDIDYDHADWAGAKLLTTATAPTIPSAPTGLTATATSGSQINLTWTNTAANQTGVNE